MNRNTIVSFAHAQFACYNEQRVAGEYGLITGTFAQDRKPNIQFRKLVIAAIMEHSGCTLAAAAVHYNAALKAATAAAPEKAAGLHRPEDKKGGRKKKEVAAATEETAAEETAAEETDEYAEAVEQFHEELQTAPQEEERVVVLADAESYDAAVELFHEELAA